MKTPEGMAFVRTLLAEADVLVENFRPGAMEKLGLGPEAVAKLNPRLIYCSCKGFLPGPYDHRVALDEVVQMMGGLAYMTGRPGDPLRAGSSVNDIMGGMFGAMGVMAALAEREKTGLGQEIQSALFENNVLLMAQHMMQYAVTGQAAAPMPARVSAWGIYDVFDFLGGEQVFLAVVTDTAWGLFCAAFGFEDLMADARLTSNNLRVQAREWMMPILRERLGHLSAKQVSECFEKQGLPYAPITKPHDLFADPHLIASGGLAPITLANGVQTLAPLLPITLGGERLGVRTSAPALGAHNQEVLRGLGYSEQEIEALGGEDV
jgi:crotonobetainyl-CoA:carnitine CoA-transferase CaiB-like acyl-CoA transferase